jgi:hypothetical protein
MITFFEFYANSLIALRLDANKSKDGTPIGKPYLRSSDIALIPESIPENGMITKVKAGSISGLAYEYTPSNNQLGD